MKPKYLTDNDLKINISDKQRYFIEMLSLIKWSSLISLRGHLYSRLMLSVISPRIIRRNQSNDSRNTYKTSRLITSHDVKQFAYLTSDSNPIHLEVGPENQPPIVHGALLMSLVAGVIGTDFPGPGSIVLSQEMSFMAACPVGTIVTIEVTLENEKTAPKPRKITCCNFSCCDSNDKSICFMKGKAKLRIKSS